MIQNGKPITLEQNGTNVDDKLMSQEKPEVQNAVIEWIHLYIKPSKNTPLPNYCSYRLKHIFERDTGIYLTNNQFKDAMMQCGYMPINPDELNWVYCLSAHSPAFNWKLDGTRTLYLPKDVLFDIWASK